MSSRPLVVPASVLQLLQQSMVTGSPSTPTTSAMTGTPAKTGTPVVPVSGKQPLQPALPTQSQAKRSVSTPVYSYKVRIINKNKKSDVKLRMIHQKTSKFESVVELRHYLATEFEDLLSEDETFDVGFMEGSQQAKVWLESTEDLSRMYSTYPNGGNITFWCHSSVLDTSPALGTKRK